MPDEELRGERGEPDARDWSVPSSDESGPGAANPHRVYRKRQFRRFLAVVTLPGILLGSASIAAAYGTGLIGNSGNGDGGCTQTVVTAPNRGSFAINVQNSNETPGQGAEVASALEKRGFKIASVSNAPDDVYVKKSAIVYHGPKGLDQALLVAQQIPGATLWDDGRDGTSVDVVIGYGFGKLIYAPPPPPPTPAEVKVNVYNTTWRSGLASQVASQLSTRGFRVADVGNDPDRAFLPDEVAALRYGPEGADAAKLLKRQLPDVLMIKDERAGATVDLVIGSGFKKLAPVKKANPTPTFPVPAETVTRPCEG